MRRFIVFVLAALLSAGSGCLWRSQRELEAQAASGMHRLGDLAENLLDYVEGKTSDPPAIGNLKEPWKDTHFAPRQAEISRLKELGCLGENNKGRLELRKCDGVKGFSAHNAAQRLLAEENKDRKLLYRRVAESGAPPGTSVAFVERLFVMKRLRRAESGQVFQLPDEGDDFKSLKDSALGQRLGASCKAEAWVAVP